MTPKRKTTSSESTSTTSSGSSSSSSSSSGSESSSSDSENSSSSANSQKASDAERTKKKPTFPANRHGKSKAETVSVPSSEAKSKERVPPKSRSVVYSSESEDSPSKVKSAKRKPPAKPKATATVAPVIKQQRPPAKSAAASVQQKNASNPKPAGNKPNKPAASTSANGKAIDKSTKTTSEPVQKKLKKKSIFSPENSSESDSGIPTKAAVTKSTNNSAKYTKTQQPKAKPNEVKQKAPAPSRSSLLTKAVQPQKSDSSASSKSCSAGSGSSGSSDSSTDSESSESIASPQPPIKKKDPQPSATVTAATSVLPKRPSATVAPVKPQKCTKRQNTVKSEDEADASASEKEMDEHGETAASKATTKGKRKLQTRKGSKLLQLQTKVASDSESDAAESKRSTSKSPVKRAGPSTQARQASGTNRPPQNTAISNNATGGRSGQGNYARARVTKERDCPLAPACDSRGHLSGKLESHFTLEACPLYHNTTPQACVEFHKDRKKREEERKKAVSCLAKKSPKGVHQTTEQRNYQLKVREQRNKWKGGSGDGNETDNESELQGNEKDRQPRLTNLTPDYDLKLFMEAQAIASEKIIPYRSNLKSMKTVSGKSVSVISMGPFPFMAPRKRGEGTERAGVRRRGQERGWYAGDRDGEMGDGGVVSEPLSRGIQPRPETLPVRVLFALREESSGVEAAQGEMLVEASSWPRGVQERQDRRVGGRRETVQAILSESLFAGQVLSGPQDAVLRRGAFPFLRDDDRGRGGVPHGRLLQQGKELFPQLQRVLHSDASALSATGIRPPPDRFQLLIDQGREKDWLAGETFIGSRPDLVSQLLEGRSAAVPLQLRGQGTLRQRYQQGDGDRLVRHRQHPTGPRDDEVLEGEAYHSQETGRDRRLQGEGEETGARLQRDRSGVSEMEPLPATKDALRLELRSATRSSNGQNHADVGLPLPPWLSPDHRTISFFFFADFVFLPLNFFLPLSTREILLFSLDEDHSFVSRVSNDPRSPWKSSKERRSS